MKLTALFLALAVAVMLVSQPAPRERVGPTPDGGFLLNSGWKIKPAGKQVPLGTLPMSSALSKDGRYLLVLNGGYRPPTVSVLRVDNMSEVQSVPVQDGWLGLTFSPDGKSVYIGGGSRAAVFEYSFVDGKLLPTRTFQIVPEVDRKNVDFIGDVAVSPDGRLLYAAGLFQDALHVVNLQTGRVTDKFATGRRPYRILFHPDGQSYFVSSWADAAIYHHNAATGARLGVVRVGPHPTDMVFRPRKPEENDEEQQAWTARIFVASANTNSVYVVGLNDQKEMRAIETINVAMTPRQPFGMTPSGLAMNAGQRQLFVACSDANAVAVVDISESGSLVDGFIPAGWYPTAVRSLADGRLLIFNGRGGGSFPNPLGPSPVKRPAPAHLAGEAVPPQYVGRLQPGSMSVINKFDDDALDEFTETVMGNSPYKDELLDAKPAKMPPIEHVVYIVKENRTYDQVFGALGRGNGDPSLALFDEKSAPNHHKLAREFVLFDNFYVNADVSADGWLWSNAAIAPDFVQKLWPNCYAARRRPCVYDSTEPAALPPAGYIWNNANAAGITMRNYGFWVTNAPKPAPGAPQVASLRDPMLGPVTNLYFRGFDLEYPDVERAKVFLEEFRQYEQKGVFPRLVFIRLGNDHTSGTTPGRVAPLSAMADNDAAFGQIVEAISKSKFWPKTAIFVLEDDAQNGADHVDSHRSPAFILSPYTRRGGVIDGSMYNTTSMLRTMELLLGLRPMTHFDAAARPMWAAFADKPDVRPYQAEKPRIPLDERNPAVSPTAARSMRLDFSEADRIDDDEMNEILWRALRNTEPPAPRRSRFSR